MEREFAQTIAGEVRNATQGWSCGEVMLAAPPLALGLLREAVQRVVPANVRVKVVAQDYTDLDEQELTAQIGRTFGM